VPPVAVAPPLPVTPPVPVPLAPPVAVAPPVPPAGTPELSLQPIAATSSAKQAETVQQDVRVIREPPMKLSFCVCAGLPAGG